MLVKGARGISTQGILESQRGNLCYGCVVEDISAVESCSLMENASTYRRLPSNL